MILYDSGLFQNTMRLLLLEITTNILDISSSKNVQPTIVPSSKINSKKQLLKTF